MVVVKNTDWMKSQFWVKSCSTTLIPAGDRDCTLVILNVRIIFDKVDLPLHSNPKVLDGRGKKIMCGIFHKWSPIFYTHIQVFVENNF